VSNPNPAYFRIGNTLLTFKEARSMLTNAADGKLRVYYVQHAELFNIPLELHKDAADAFEKWLTEK
jgi:hypothetical protein